MSPIRLFSGIIGSLIVLPSAYAAVVYDESSLGDLSNDRAHPTLVVLGTGSNVVTGTVGIIDGTKDLDYFVVTLSKGQSLNALTVLQGTASSGSVSFIGVQSGATMTLDPDSKPFPDPKILLGWKHYSKHDVGQDILPKMGDAVATGSQGFSAPLGPGSYTFWVQETSTGPVDYRFDFITTAVTAVPETASSALFLTGLCAIGLHLRRRRDT